LILILAHPESIYPDENLYILLGKSIVNGGDYGWGFPDARPIIPSLIALFLFIGFDIYTIQFLIPLIFMNLTIIVTYFLAKTMYGEKEAIIATLFLFTFPFFWCYGLSMLIDIPLAALSSLFILFFYLGVEKDKKYLLISAIFFVLAFLTKASAILLIAPAFLYLLIANKRLILTKEFVISVVIVPVLFLFVFGIFHIFLSASVDTSASSQGLCASIHYWEMLTLGYAPVLLFGFFGISREKRDIFLSLTVLIFITFFSLTNFHVRYLSPLFPIFGIFVALGYINLRDKFNRKKIVNLVLIIFLIISVANSLYLVDLSNNASWGVVTLSKHVNTIEGNVTIASYYHLFYLKVSTAKNVISIPRYYEFNGEMIDVDKFWSIVTNKSNPKSSRYAELSKSGQIKSYFYYFDDEWIEDNHVDYVILSIYEEGRSSEMRYHHPKYAWIEVPFIKTSIYTSDLFQSKLYKICEEKYERVDEVYKEKDLTFIIYKV
jgi:4-amino-4-deoxy-L-arabinose transferase-like glycosyltransferase